MTTPFFYTGKGSPSDPSIVLSKVKNGRRPDNFHEVAKKFYVEVPLPKNVNPKYEVDTTIIPLMRECWGDTPAERPEFTSKYG